MAQCIEARRARTSRRLQAARAMAVAPRLSSGWFLKSAHPTDHIRWRCAATRGAGFWDPMLDVRSLTHWLRVLPCPVGANDVGRPSTSSPERCQLDATPRCWLRTEAVSFTGGGVDFANVLGLSGQSSASGTGAEETQ